MLRGGGRDDREQPRGTPTVNYYQASWTSTADLPAPIFLDDDQARTTDAHVEVQAKAVPTRRQVTTTSTSACGLALDEANPAGAARSPISASVSSRTSTGSGITDRLGIGTGRPLHRRLGCCHAQRQTSRDAEGAISVWTSGAATMDSADFDKDEFAADSEGPCHAGRHASGNGFSGVTATRDHARRPDGVRQPSRASSAAASTAPRSRL